MAAEGSARNQVLTALQGIPLTAEHPSFVHFVPGLPPRPPLLRGRLSWGRIAAERSDLPEGGFYLPDPRVQFGPSDSQPKAATCP